MLCDSSIYLTTYLDDQMTLQCKGLGLGLCGGGGSGGGGFAVEELLISRLQSTCRYNYGVR